MRFDDLDRAAAREIRIDLGWVFGIGESATAGAVGLR